ncbi:hypothetical protein SLA2020_342890 [Shorea laevis]
MEDMRDSIVLPQIVKIVRMVVKFHPLLIITSFTFQVIFLQHYIEGEVSNQWNVLKVYCQSTMRATLELITEKTESIQSPPDSSQQRHGKGSTKGQGDWSSRLVLCDISSTRYRV